MIAKNSHQALSSAREVTLYLRLRERAYKRARQRDGRRRPKSKLRGNKQHAPLLVFLGWVARRNLDVHAVKEAMRGVGRRKS